MATMSAADPVVTPAPVVLDPNLAGRGTRLVAKIIDNVIASLLWAPAFIGGMGAAIASAGADPETSDPTAMIGVMLGSSGISVFLTLIYVVVQIWLLTKDGQTIGKKIMKIKVVNFETGVNGGFVPNVLLRAVVNALINGVTGGIYGLVDVFLIFRDDRRCLHDLIANTKVVHA
jgi:uncharacterized RDD family membrane protein YckC